MTLTGEQRYAQAVQKARIVGQRNLRAYLADKIPYLPMIDERRFIIAEIDRAVSIARSEQST